jgi:pilus assembly protein CpaC
MKKQWSWAAIGLVAMQSIAAPVHETDVTMYVGEAKVLNEPGVRRLAVGNGQVLNATVLDERQVLVLAEEEGQSSLYVWRRAGEEHAYTITVVPANVGRLLVEVRALLGENDRVRTRVVGDKIILEGSDLTDEQARRIEEIGKRYPQIVNLISRVGLEPMVVTDVRILEFRKTALRDLGIRWSTDSIAGPTYGVLGDISRSAPFVQPPEGTGTASGRGPVVNSRISPFATYFELNSTITSAISAAVSKGDATFLAEPRLTTKSGGSAKFLAGGEVPIPVDNGFGSVTVQFKPYGVKLEVTPLVGESGAINLSVLTELSAVDAELTVRDVPAFLTRRTDTQVNLKTSETLVISGLFDGVATRSLEKVPGLGDIPVLGELFRSRRFRRNETDLVILLTPRLVAPGREASTDQPKSTEQKADRAQREFEFKKSPEERPRQ